MLLFTDSHIDHILPLIGITKLPMVIAKLLRVLTKLLELFTKLLKFLIGSNQLFL